MKVALVRTVQQPIEELPFKTETNAPSPASHGETHYCENFHKAICDQRTGAHIDPSGRVYSDFEGEKTALTLLEEIVKKYPDLTSEQASDQLVTQIYTHNRVRRLQAAFSWVQSRIINFINSQTDTVFTKKEKKLLKARIEAVRLQLPPPSTTYADEPDLYTKSDVFYERLSDGATRMRVGGAFLLSSDSWFNLVFTMAHEFAHSIDPCELRTTRSAIPAYDRLSACFLENGLIEARKTRSECGQDDQLSETFADWVAVQISVEALKHYATEFDRAQLFMAAANSVRDLCEDDSFELGDFQYHPKPEIRIDRIFGRNPKIREILGCNAPLSPGRELASQARIQDYCSFTFEPSPKPAKGKTK